MARRNRRGSAIRFCLPRLLDGYPRVTRGPNTRKGEKVDREKLLRVFREERELLRNLGQEPKSEVVWNNVIDNTWGALPAVPLRAFVVLLLGEAFP